jgi:putative peptidoglycan lipid II flippase
MVLAALTTLGMLFPSQVAGTITDFDDQQTALATEMLRWMLLALPFLSLSVMGYLLLNSYKRFGVAALGDLAFKVVMVVALVLLFWFLGWPALVIAMACGAAVKLGLYIWGLRREGVHYRPVLKLWTPAMKRFYVVMLPLLIGALVALGRDYAEGYFRTGAEEGKAASIVRYARVWVDTPIQVLMLPLGIAIFPFITEASARGRHRELFDGFFSICRGVLLIFIPMTVAMLFLRTPLIQTLFEWHKFKASDTALTSQTLFYYVFAFVPLALEIIILQYFYARRNTVTPTIAGVVASVLNIALLWWLLRETQIGMGAFTLAVVVTKGLKVVVLIALLKQLFPEEHNWGHELGRVGDGLVRIALATAVMWGTMFVLSMGLTHVLDIHRKLGGLAYIGAITGAGFGSYLLMVVLLRVEEARMMISWVRQRIRK